MKKHGNLPPDGIAREMGYSSIAIDAEINPSMLEKVESSSVLILSRLKDAPVLPISCLASAEHVISMQNQVVDFVSESQPSSENKVMYQILVRPFAIGNTRNTNKALLLKAFLTYDPQLRIKDVSIQFLTKTKLFSIEISTQIGDIQKTIKAIKSLKMFTIINYEFADIGLNEGLCLIKGNATNPIHALVNIANTDSKKGFLERDAGLTSGQKTASYQDNHWTFNFYESLSDLQHRTGYTEKSSAVRLFLKP